MNALLEAIKQLHVELKLLPLKLALHEGEFQKAVDAEIERPKKRNEMGNAEAIDPAFNQLSDYKQALICELEAAIVLASERNIETPVCRQLIESLRGGFDTPEPLQFLFAAKVEIANLRRAVEQTATPDKPSRKQPEKDVTRWVRKNRQKYDNNADAVRAYIEINGGKYHKLYRDLNNDLRHKRL